MIVLTILKWIGFALLALLGLAVFLILLVTFYPVIYKIKIDDCDVWVRFSYMFHIIRGYVSYVDGNLDYSAKIAWIKVVSTDEDKFEKETVKKNKENSKSEPAKTAKMVKVQESSDTDTDRVKEADKGQDSEQPRSQSDFGKRKKDRKNYFEVFKGYVRKTWGSFRRKIEGIKDGFSQYTDDCAKAAYAHLLRELVVFLKHIRPRFGHLDFTLGFEDPSYSGLLLAVYSLIYTKVHKRLKFNADFENAGYSGRGTVGGMVQLYIVLLIGVRLLFDRNLRTFLDRR